MIKVCDRTYKNPWQIFWRLKIRYFDGIYTKTAVKRNCMRVRTDIYGKFYLIEIHLRKNKDNDDWMGNIRLFSDGEWWHREYRFLTLHGLCSHLHYLTIGGDLHHERFGIKNCIIKRKDDGKLAEKLGVETKKVTKARQSDEKEYWKQQKKKEKKKKL